MPDEQDKEKDKNDKDKDKDKDNGRPVDPPEPPPGREVG